MFYLSDAIFALDPTNDIELLKKNSDDPYKYSYKEPIYVISNQTSIPATYSQSNGTIIQQHHAHQCPIHLYSSRPVLWLFIIKHLLHPPQNKCVLWINALQGIIKINDPVGFARLWALQKNRLSMKYENLARSIRTYASKGLMKREKNEKM
ncbi:hypothetical protein MXB_4788, partial [Myxobolus squamalis]